ncbi:hypothetical protein AB0H49_10160 [Nocardia sp. NPDC050713]|uniref:hypothetical protein n=1 Tax=Nocardia sp. NPDC050713 TaxID=3154511 RepID=UPI0033E76E20
MQPDTRWSRQNRRDACQIIMRPGIGWIMPFALPRVMQRMADDLADYAVGAPDPTP